MLGVALAFAVHVINASALDEFSQAIAVNGPADLERAPCRAVRLRACTNAPANDPQVARASPLLELGRPWRRQPPQQARMQGRQDPSPHSHPIRVPGADAPLPPTMGPGAGATPLGRRPTSSPLRPRHGVPQHGGASRHLGLPATAPLHRRPCPALGWRWACKLHSPVRVVAP